MWVSLMLFKAACSFEISFEVQKKLIKFSGVHNTSARPIMLALFPIIICGRIVTQKKLTHAGK